MWRTARRDADRNPNASESVNNMEASATAKRLPISPRKIRLVANQVRGKEVGAALDFLNYNTRKGAALVLKVLESAIANAENNEGADIDELKVSRIHVDEGRTMKRGRPRARGRIDRIFKRTSHVTVTVTDD